MRRFLVYATITAWMAAGLSCSQPALSGGGTDVSNAKVKGAVVDPYGAPVADAEIYIRETSFLAAYPDTGQAAAPDGYTDSLGCFMLPSMELGEYLMEIVSGDSLWLCVPFYVQENDTMIFLGVDTLKAPGAIRGRATRTSSGSETICVAVFGLDCVVAAEAIDGWFYLPRIPAGMYSLNISIPGTYAIPVRLDSVKVQPGMETSVGTVQIVYFW